MKYILPALLVIASVLSFPVHGSAQETEEWEPPNPSADSFDWIKLKSGEWLKGEIKGLRDDDFEFDSDELDLLQLDWDDVAELRSPRFETYFFEGEIIAAGPATMKDGIIRIRVGDEIQEFQRADLLSIIEGKPTEWYYWRVKFSAGLVGRSGNTDQSDFNARFNIRREAPKSRFDINYVGNFSEVADEDIVRNHLASAKFQRFVHRNLFVTPAALQLYSDEFQNINTQTTFGVSLGIFILRNKTVQLFLSLGGGYTHIDYISVPEGVDNPKEDGVVIPVLGFEWDITDDIEWTLDYDSNITVQDLGSSVHHLVAALTVEIQDYVNFTTSVSLDRVSQPQPNEEGITPVPNDVRISFGLGVSF
jgi:putative salt-induced outer membrane protein YdiY